MRVLISGYYGYDNLGDEWLLETVIGFLKKSNYQLTVLSNQPKKTSANYQVNAIFRWNPFQFVRQLLNSDLLLFGGGGLVQDLSGIKTPFYYLSQALIAKVLGKKVVMLGQGFGPVKYVINRLLCEFIMPLADLVIVRDQASMFWCKQLGLDEGRIIKAADLVWLKPFEFKKNNKNKTWLICLRSDWLKHELPGWVKAVKIRADKENVRVAFVAIGNRGDDQLLESVRQRPLFKDCSFYTRRDYLEAFNQATLVISMRYHGLVLGALAGVPLIGMGKDPKIESIIESLQQVMASEYNIEDMIKLVLNQYELYQSSLVVRSAQFKQDAKKNILALQAFLLNAT